MSTNTANTPVTKPASGIQMLDILGDLAKPAAAKSSAKNYPAIPDPDGSVGQLADHLASDLEEWKSLDASVATGKAELTALGRQAFYTANRGLKEPASSVVARGKKSEILVTFQNRYTGSADPAAVTALIGADDAGRYFYQSFELKIDGDSIPADKAPAIIAEIREALARHDCAAALSAAAKVKPTKEYHAARHAWTPEINLELDRLVPPVAVVKVKA